MILKRSIVAAAPEQISSDLGGEVVILHLKKGVYYGLDEVGARIWELIQEPRTVGYVQEVLMAEYDVEAECCERDLLDILKHLASEDLITVDNGPIA